MRQPSFNVFNPAVLIDYRRTKFGLGKGTANRVRVAFRPLGYVIVRSSGGFRKGL